MISFRLNRDRGDDRIIWDYLEREEANRSQLIKELLVQSINKDSQKTENKEGREDLLKEHALLLLKIREEMGVLKNMEEMKEHIRSIYKRLSFLPETESLKEMDDDEEALFKTIFEQNPIEYIK